MTAVRLHRASHGLVVASRGTPFARIESAGRGWWIFATLAIGHDTMAMLQAGSLKAIDKERDADTGQLLHLPKWCGAWGNASSREVATFEAAREFAGQLRVWTRDISEVPRPPVTDTGIVTRQVRR